LILIGQPAPERGAQGLGDLLRVHAIPNDARNPRELAKARLRGPAFYVLRPDGHVGLAGRRFDAVAIYDYFGDCGVRRVPSQPSRAMLGGAALGVDMHGVENR
jgi:hypothetical protein